MAYAENIALAAEAHFDAAQANSEAACDLRAAREDARQTAIDAKAEKFTTLFLGQPLNAYTGDMRRSYMGEGFHVKVPQTVGDMAADALECGDLNIDRGIAVLLAAVQLCARKGDVDALKAVSALSLAWAAEHVGVA